jgi:hypothetical protein
VTTAAIACLALGPMPITRGAADTVSLPSLRLGRRSRLYSQTVLMYGRMAETLGIGTMDRKGFQAWLSVVDGLSEVQKAEAMEVLAGRPVGEAALAAVELGVGEDRRCPRCGTTGAVSNGTARGLKRYRCKGYGKTFGALTGTPLSGLHRKEVWLTFGECLSAGDTVKTSAEQCEIA